MIGVVVLLGAPLGNSADASTRLRDELASADIVAAEDTRRLARLATDLGVSISGKVVSYFEGNEQRRTDDLVRAAVGGARVAVITDGGMPSVSDPGFRLVRAALDAGVPVHAVPGPSAVTTALVVSGLPCDRFCFEGFLPRQAAARRARLASLAEEERTMVFFEAPHRVAACLLDAANAFGDERAAAVCRELTKTYEEVRRGSLSSLVAWASEQPVRGEVTLVVAGAPERRQNPLSEVDIASLVDGLVASGLSTKDAVAAISRERGLPRREVYAIATRRARPLESPR